MSSFLVCALLLGFTVDGATSKVSPVQKVIELLDGLSAKVQGELDNEAQLMSDYTNWCDSEANSKEDAITDEKRTIGDLEASIGEASGEIAALTSEINDLATKISADEQDLKAATDIRNKEHSDFEASEAELGETVDTLDRAISVLKRGQFNFLQNKEAPKELAMLSTGLSKIIEASWIDSHEKSVVQSLLQSGEADEDADLSLEPAQAHVSAFESQGGGILDTLADMKGKAEASLSDARKNEMSSNHAFELLKQGLDDELAVMKNRMSEAQASRSSQEEAKGAAGSDLSATQAALESDTAYLGDLKQSCAAKAAEWETRQKTAAEERAAIAKARSILADGVVALLQVGNARTLRDSETSAARDEASKILRILAKKHNLYALSQLVSAVQSDPFGKVRGLIESMITRLEKEAAEESDAKSFCDTEISESRAKQAALTAAQDKHATRIEKAEAGNAKLAQAIKTLTEEIGEIDAGQSSATALRQKEHAEFTKSSAEYKQSAEAVANAMQVLQDYYNAGASLVQTKAAPEFGGAKSDVGSTIISMLEVAESDFTRLLAEAEAEESEAAANYEKLTQANAVAKSSKQADVKGKEAEVKSLERATLNYKEDHANTSKELDAVLTYLDKLKPQCETKVMSYAERKQRREEEIDGLKEALTILSA